MQSISTLLTKFPKKSQLQQAYIFAITKEYIEAFQTEFYDNLEADFQSLSTSINLKPNHIKIGLKSSDNAFVTFLKTEIVTLSEYLVTKLKKRLDLADNFVIELEIKLQK
jgi:hypothetical protein